MRPLTEYAAVRERAGRLLETLVAKQHYDVLCAELLYVLDEECRQRLTIGASEVFGSVKSIREPFFDAIRSVASDIGLTAEVNNDRTLLEEFFQMFLRRMVKDGDLIFASDRQRARSRALEVVHYLRHLRQRTALNEKTGFRPRLVELMKVETRKRERPVRARKLDELQDSLSDLEYEQTAEHLEALPPREKLDDVKEAFGAFFERVFDPPKFADFQVRAFKQLLTDAFLEPGEESKAVVIAAGTGFGKTEAFLFPILFYSAYARLLKHKNQQEGSDGATGIDAILLYPRVDLCDNQAERLVGYLYHLNAVLTEKFGEALGAPLRVALAHSRINGTFRIRCPACLVDEKAAGASWTENDKNKAFLRARIVAQDKVEGFICDRKLEHQDVADMLVYQVRRDSREADLLITTIDTLHRRLMDPHGESALFKPRKLPPRFVVLDEMHIYEGQHGAHAAHILRRCRQRISRMRRDITVPPIFIGASATAGSPERLAARMFGVSKDKVQLIQPGSEEKKTQGLEYFFFLRSPGNRLVDENPPPPGAQEDSQDDDSQDEPPIPTPASPPQSHFVSERATMIQAAFALQHTMKAPASPGAKRRTLGFVDSVDSAQRLGSQLDNAEWQDFGPGTIKSKGRPPAGHQKPPLYAYRLPVGRPGATATDLANEIKAAAAEFSRGQVVPASFDLPTLGAGCIRQVSRNCHQPPHHLLERCDRYEDGECWFAMAHPGEEGLRPIAIQTHRSGRRGWGDSLRRWDDADKDQWRQLISTSALEVGFDHPEIIATWQHHTPPSVASFVQRKGRGGRGVRDYPITMMVLGSGPADTYSFQNHLKFVDAADFSNYVDEENPSVRMQHVFSAVFDWCAAQSAYQQAYSCDFDQLWKALRQPELRDWLSACFDMRSKAVIDALEMIQKYVQDAWQAPLDSSGKELLGRDLVRPIDLFQPAAEKKIAVWKDRIQSKVDVERTRQWLDAAERFFESRDENRVRYVVDFCRHVPDSLLVNPDLYVPSTTLSIPIGRHVDMLGRRENQPPQWIAQEPTEFALRAFLPGGFKVRYEGLMWMAPWQPAANLVPTGNVTWAATRAQLREVRTPGSPTTLLELLKETDLEENARRQILSAAGEDSVLVFPSGLEIQSLGRQMARTFQLDETTKTIVPRKPDSATGPYTLLTRDPNVTPRMLVIPRRSHSWRPVWSGNGLLTAVNFHDTFRLVVAHYANLVHCYPKDDEVRTLVVRFHDETVSRPLAAAMEVRSQGVEFVIRCEDERLRSWTPAQRAHAFWRRVSSEALEVLVVQRGLLPNMYLLPRMVTLLRWVEASLRGRVGAFAERPPTDAELREALTPPLAGQQDVAQLVVQSSAILAQILQGAATWTETNGARFTLADSLVVALARTLCGRINVSPWSLRRLVDVRGTNIHLTLYDDIDGGSGNARRIAEEFSRWIPERLWQSVERDLDCPAAGMDAAVAAALSSKLSPDVLSLMAHRDQLPEEWAARLASPARARHRLRHLLETPAFAAFNIYAHEEWRLLQEQLSAPPPHLAFVARIYATPALDPRAEAMRQQFIRKQDGLPELPARLQAIEPLCSTGCPECLSGDRFEDERFIDRVFLLKFITERTE